MLHSSELADPANSRPKGFLPPCLGLHYIVEIGVIYRGATVTATLVSSEARSLHLDVLHVPALRPFDWLRRGWLDMRRVASLGYGALIFALVWTLLGFC